MQKQFLKTLIDNVPLLIQDSASYKQAQSVENDSLANDSEWKLIMRCAISMA